MTARSQRLQRVEVEELTQLKPFVTDIRPESSSGVTSQPGMFATVYLKPSRRRRKRKAGR